jgi:hypothetical protein
MVTYKDNRTSDHDSLGSIDIAIDDRVSRSATNCSPYLTCRPLASQTTLQASYCSYIRLFDTEAHRSNRYDRSRTRCHRVSRGCTLRPPYSTRSHRCQYLSKSFLSGSTLRHDATRAYPVDDRARALSSAQLSVPAI